ncbi:MAG: hypothetical protein ACHQRJ_00325 [Alphaproteobacteria bacterium]
MLPREQIEALPWSEWQSAPTRAAAVKKLKKAWPNAQVPGEDNGKIELWWGMSRDGVLVGEAQGRLKRGVFTEWRWRVRLRPSVPSAGG